MVEEQPDKRDRKTLARRNKLTALGLGLVALMVYIGYFLFKYLT